jgi:sugar phosphate isomerase/epimerase
MEEIAMKPCVSSYSFGRYFEQLGAEGVIEKAKEFGLSAIEFTDGGWTDNLSLDTAKRVREKAEELGIEIAALCVGADFLTGDTAAMLEQLRRCVDFAAALGAKAMRHDVAQQPRSRKYQIGYSDVLPTLASACREITKYAEQLGVRTMTENHGYFSQDANRVESLINTVGHPNFGALIDVGNFMCVDEDPVVSVGIMAPYAFHVHAKDFHFKPGMFDYPGGGWFITRSGNYLRGAIIGHGDAKVAQSIGILKRAGYDGYVSIEFEGIEDNLLGIRLGLENLKRYIELK